MNLIASGPNIQYILGPYSVHPKSYKFRILWKIFDVKISGIILLVAMIGAITLTFSRRENVKRQSYFAQINRDKDSAVSLVDVENRKGVNLDE